MPQRIEYPANLRAEARFALLCGVILLVLGLGIALGFAAFGAGSPEFMGVMLATPPCVFGWGICHLASWRLEQAMRLERGVAKVKAKRRSSLGPTLWRRQGKA